MQLWKAFQDPLLLGATFQPLDDWAAHLAILKAIEGDFDAMTEVERELVAECCGRDVKEPAREALLLIGRRGGKSRLGAAIGVGLATLRDWPNLAAGEQGVVALVAPSRSQAQNLRRYCGGIVEASPLISSRVTGETATAIEFGRTRIEVLTASRTTLRSFTCCAVILDEPAHMIDTETSANPTAEIVRAVRPSLASSEGSLLLSITTPWARSGAVYEMFRDHYAKPGDVLVWTAPSTRVNRSPWLAAEVEREMQRDPVNARTEYFCEWRSDIEAFLSREQIATCIEPNRGPLPPRDGERYFAFVDSSGGVADSYTAAIAHLETRDGRRIAVVDQVAERKAPFDPRAVTRDFAALLRHYGITRVRGDRYAAGFSEGAWREEGFTYEPAPLSASELYRALIPAILAGAVDLPDDERLIGQLIALERRVSRGGREEISHPRNGHDDVAVAAAGVVQLVLARHKGVSADEIYGPAGTYAAEIAAAPLWSDLEGDARLEHADRWIAERLRD